MNQFVTVLLMLMLGFSVPCMAQNVEHKVRVGEDFASIAQKYGITEQQLIDANPKSRGICYVGQKLIIPQQQATTPTPSVSSTQPQQTVTPQNAVIPETPKSTETPEISKDTETPEIPKATSSPDTKRTITNRVPKTGSNNIHPRNVEISDDSDYKPVNRGLMGFGRGSLTISGRYEGFLNDVFYQYADRKDIKSQIGIEGSCSYILFSPLALEVTGFYTTYKVEPLAKDDDEKKVVHAGAEFFADAYFLPYVGKLSDYFAPYAGIGYQTSSLTWGKDVSAGTGNAMIKCGAKIALGLGVHLRLEYKQTLPKSSNKLFYACAIGLGYKL